MIRTAFLLLLLPFSVYSQGNLQGSTKDNHQMPYVGILIKLEQIQTETHSDKDGNYLFENVPTGEYAISFHYGYDILYKKVKINEGENTFNVQIDRQIEFDEVIIKSSKWGTSKFANNENITQEEISNMPQILDVPGSLQHLTNATLQTDGGIGIGYSGIRFRGIDPSHVQINLNGIPLNDAESSLAYFVDIPDIMSNAEEIQVFKGFVPGRTGAGAFGAAIDFNMNKFHIDPFVHVNLSQGAFHSRKFSIVANTGLFENHYALECRISRQQSDGFIDRSGSDLKSFFLSGAVVKKSYGLRMNILFGNERTDQAWNGVPAHFLDSDSLYRKNFSGTEKLPEPYVDEDDRYKQSHVQLFFARALQKRNVLNIILNYTHGQGYYENYKANRELQLYGLIHPDTLKSDLVLRKWLKNDFVFTQFNIENNINSKLKILYGLNFNIYSGNHFGQAIWTSLSRVENLFNLYYDNTGKKFEESAFLKFDFFANDRFNFGLDLHTRVVQYKINGLDENYGSLNESEQYLLNSPKFFAAYNWSKKWVADFSMGYFEREPFREDILSQENSRKEQLLDFELGVSKRTETQLWTLNFYSMEYFHQLVYNGELNSVGEPLKENVGRSYRRGIELKVQQSILKTIKLNANAAFNEARVYHYKEVIPVYNSEGNVSSFKTNILNNSPLTFSPNFIGHCDIKWDVYQDSKKGRSLSFNLNQTFVTHQFLDNSGNPNSKINGYHLSNSLCSYDFKILRKYKVTTWFELNNIFDLKYTSHGWIQRFGSTSMLNRQDDPYLNEESSELYNSKGIFPQAGRNVFFGLKLNF